MKKNLFFAMMVLMMMTACNKKKTMDTLNGEWAVATIGEMTVPDSTNAFMGFDVTGKIVYGSTGCNQLTGAMPETLSTGTPLFGTLGCTRKMCSNMTVEDAMLPALSTVVDFKVEGNKLYLLDATGNTVISLLKR